MKKDYKKIINISIAITAVAFVFMTLGFFVAIVYVKDGWSPVSHFVISAILYVPGIAGIVWGNKVKTQARIEALRVD